MLIHSISLFSLVFIESSLGKSHGKICLSSAPSVSHFKGGRGKKKKKITLANKSNDPVAYK